MKNGDGMNAFDACVNYDRLKSSVRSMLTTNDEKELPKLYGNAVFHLGIIYTYAGKKFAKHFEKRQSEVDQ